MPKRPHFAFPFERGPDGKVRVVEQDTTDHVMSCENVIVRCPLGFRQDRPEFGVPWPAFASTPIDPGGIEDALRRFEPRSNARGEEYADVVDASLRTIDIEVQS